MRAAGKQAQHTKGIFLIPRLSENPAVTDDDRVRRNDQGVRVAA